MQSSFEPGAQVLVYETPFLRSRAEAAGEETIPARPARVEEDVTPRATKWDAWAPVPGGRPGQYGAYVDAGPEGDAVYRVRFADDGSTAAVSVHLLTTPAEIAAALHQRAQAAEAAAHEHSAAAAKHSAEAERLRQAAKAVHPGK